MLKNEIIEKLNKLVSAHMTLKSNILSKGIAAAENDRFSELAEKVGELENEAYAVEGEITLVSSSPMLTLSNLPLKPKEVGVASRSLAEATITSTVSGFVVPAVHAVFDEDSDTKEVDECVVKRIYDSEADTWSVTFSFADYNTAHSNSFIKFQGGFIYSWLVLFHTLYSEETENA